MAINAMRVCFICLMGIMGAKLQKKARTSKKMHTNSHNKAGLLINKAGLFHNKGGLLNDKAGLLKN